MPHMDKLSNYKTTVAHDGNHQVVTYHSTQILKWNEEEILLNSGGWKTVTTARKLRQAATQFNLGYRLYIKAGVWTVEYNGHTYPFVDGMKIFRHIARKAV